MRRWLQAIFFREKTAVDTLQRASEALAEQQDLIDSYRASIDQWQIRALEAVKLQRDLAIAFRIAVEKPEIDIRENLDQLISDLSDNIAQLEEQIVP